MTFLFPLLFPRTPCFSYIIPFYPFSKVIKVFKGHCPFLKDIQRSLHIISLFFSLLSSLFLSPFNDQMTFFKIFLKNKEIKIIL